MDGSAERKPTRVLALGNELLGDDAFAFEVARRLRDVETVCSSVSGFHLLDDVLGVERLIVVDTVQTGRTTVGALRIIREQELEFAPGTAPHGTGIFEMLEVARRLGLDAPREVIIVAVEAADCITVGGRMHSSVRAAVEPAAALVSRLAQGG
ncbi:MAG: hydrogenase maturation protease [Bryobacteraceae bacterium]